jgi:hypothetical protein
MTAIDDLNYAADIRVRNAGKNKPPTVFDDAGNEIELPSKWIVCPTCNGKGRHVNPSIDCGGISAQDFADDPDFADDYMGGTYDQTCAQCEGRTTILGVDFDAMTPMLRAMWEQQARDDADYAAECAAEIRAGC